MVEGLQPLSVAALHYRAEDLDPGFTKKGIRHIDVHPRSDVYLNVDLVQRGLGGDDSWGRLPHQEYRLLNDSYAYSYIIRPFVR